MEISIVPSTDNCWLVLFGVLCLGFCGNCPLGSAFSSVDTTKKEKQKSKYIFNSLCFSDTKLPLYSVTLEADI